MHSKDFVDVLTVQERTTKVVGRIERCWIDLGEEIRLNEARDRAGHIWDRSLHLILVASPQPNPSISLMSGT